eukprot:7584144-Lingulodinium_polyedra.AAC.1
MAPDKHLNGDYVQERANCRAWMAIATGTPLPHSYFTGLVCCHLHVLRPGHAFDHTERTTPRGPCPAGA